MPSLLPPPTRKDLEKNGGRTTGAYATLVTTAVGQQLGGAALLSPPVSGGAGGLSSASLTALQPLDTNAVGKTHGSAMKASPGD